MGQSVFKGFKVRQKQAAAEDLPDLKDPEMAKAAVKIQSVFKGFKVRQKKAAADDLPNLNDKEVQAATVKIQSAFKVFNLRKEKKKEKDAAELIQRNFRGYRRRKQIGFSDTVDVIHAAIRI